MSSKIQSTFGSARSLTCNTCGMTFQRHIAKDKAMHAKYHSEFINGIPWKKGPEKALEKVNITVDKISIEVQATSIDPGLVLQVRKVEKLLEMVNSELNAPAANDAWKSKEGTNTGKLKIDSGTGLTIVPGRAFVLLAMSRAIGLVVTEPILDVGAQSRWMVHSTQDIVPSQVNKNTRIGISRIWIASKWRRRGLGNVLLRAVLRHSVYGMSLKPAQVAFSQPSHAGGLLAKSFNGVKHKSGEVLVPVYLES